MTATFDTNILLYASDAASALQKRALQLLDEFTRGPALTYVFWPVVFGYLRIATHPRVFERPLTPVQAAANISQLLRRPCLRSVGETEGFWSAYRSLAHDVQPRGNLVSDAHLVALMHQYGVSTIYSRDRDFRKFSGIVVKDPFEHE